MPSHVYREYDIRGVAERDLTSDLAFQLGQGLAQMLRPDPAKPLPRIALGRDCRLSGPRLFDAMAKGLVAGGAHVLDIGIGPTPKLYFSVFHLETDGGIMVTGSHNPAEDNGFKIMRGKSSFFGDAIQELKSLVEAGQPPATTPGKLELASVDEAYLKRVTSDIELPNRNLKFVVDAGNGSAGPLGIAAMKRLGLEPITMFCEMDGRFPNHHPDPTVPKNLEALIDRVNREKAVVGIAWDGDGDRLGVVDASGEIIWGDRLLALFARGILQKMPGAAVIGDVKCSQSLFDDVNRHGGRGIMWKTGHSLIKTKMKEEHAAIAGEMSGHFFFADRYYGYDDAVYASLRLLEILSQTGKTVGELLSDIPKLYSTPEIRVDCPDDAKVAVVDSVRAQLSGKGQINRIDGVRVTYEDGAWALVRASNTGPVIVLRFEAPSEARLAALRNEIEGMVRSARQSVGA
ncbi:MAG TPA: phosphomannomutase/phosphoglucomutase [Polyangiaceae bacterium]|jgi:phosphomannomutase/phosphoglucomutase|nr:phosphomannomutase/phosphoglucomutase [Polyangiaceae bacterium]